MLDQLKRLERIITKQNAKIFDYYNAGIDRTVIESQFKSAGFTPTEDLVSLYQWRNGLKDWSIPTGWSSIFPLGVFASLESALDEYGTLRKNYSSFLPTTHFPIQLEDYITIDLGQGSSNLGALFILSPALVIMEPVKVYSSLKSYIDTQVFCYENEVLKFTDTGELLIDFENKRTISQEFNPDCAYWKK